MANIAGSYNSNQSFNPKFVYTISYSETGRSATAVTYSFTVSYTKTNGWYGYDININWNIGGATGSKQIKSTADLSSGSTTFSVTCSTNAAGGTLSAQIWTTSSTDPTHSQNAMNTGAQTVNKSTFNTAPSLSGSVTANGSTSNNYTSETTKAITITWPAATDANSNLSGYRLRVSINGAGYTELTRTNSSTRTYTHNIADYGEGTTFKYAVDAYDSYSEWSGTINSGTVTKNRLAGSAIATSAKINYLDSSGTISFTVSGGSNTDGSAIASRKLTCDGITVYNNTVSTGTVNLTVYVSGTTPTGAYVKFDDIKNKFASDSYRGTLTFKMNTENNYGTVKVTSATVSVDLRTNPNAVSSCSIVEGAASTAYRTVTSTSTGYFIPDGTKVIRVTWAGGSGKLGEAITYSLYVAYGSGSWQLVAQNISSGTKTYDHKVPKQTSQVAIKYMVRVVNSYNYHADNTTSAKQLHYYNGPTISTGTITRTATTCAVLVTINSNTSIPNVNTVGTWICTTTGTTTPTISSGSLTQAQTAQNVTATSLVDSGIYDLVITYKDDTGFSSNQTTTITIPANSPVFFVNKYGIGVNSLKANTSYALNVKGGGYISGGVTFPNNVGIRDSSGKIILRNNGTSTVLSSSNDTVFIRPQGDSVDTNQVTISTAGVLNAPNLQVGGNNVYHVARKPSASDVGALPINGGTLTGPLYIGNGLTATGANTNTYSRIVRPSTDDESCVKLQFGKGTKATFEIIDSAWTTGLFAVDAAGVVKIKGAEIVAQGSGTNGWYVRLYDGTQICVGWSSWNSVSMINDLASSNIYGDTSIGTNGRNVTFSANFVSAPYVIANTNSTGYMNTHVVSSTTSSFQFRIWANYYSVHSAVVTNYIAIGRWK